MSTMKASVKGRYEVFKEKSTASTQATVTFNAGDAKLKLSATDATFSSKGLQDLTLSFEKPGNFMVDYFVPKNDYRFQFMNTVRVVGKPVSLTYIHFKGANRTSLDGSLVVDPSNKVSGSWTAGTRNGKLKYVYSHGEMRRMVFEQGYDIANKAWDFAVSRRFSGDDVVRVSYQTLNKNLGLEWSRDSKINGSFKIVATTNMGEQPRALKLTAETTWNYEI